MNIRVVILILLSMLALGCAKGTSVILLEDPDGHVGAVTVSTQSGQARLDKAGTETVAASATSAPSKAKTVSQKDIDKRFGQTLAALPAPVTTFILYFKPGGTILTPKSEPIPDAIVAKVLERGSSDVRINGHTDRVGSKEQNEALSLRRAHAIRDTLVRKGLDPAIMQVFTHGEGNPLVPTPDNVAEPLNRRVEVLVR